MDYEPLTIELIKKTARLFYDPGPIVILDILIKKLVLFDYELSECLKMLPKEFNKAIVKLKEDRLICSESKIDNNESTMNGNRNGGRNDNITSGLSGMGAKGFIRTVYYLDYCKIKDVIKYKIFKMSKRFEESTIKCTDDALLYICKICKREFNLYEIQSLMNDDYRLKCDECMGELEENKVVASNDELILHKKMMEEVGDIIEILKKLDKYDIPNVDYFQVVKLRDEKIKQENIKKELNKISGLNKKEDGFVDVFVDDEDKKSGHDVNIFDEKIKNESIENIISDDEIIEIVKVKGVEKKFHEITEDDKINMSTEEYVHYYDVYMKYNLSM